MGKINSKQKGTRFERLLAGLFRDYGFRDGYRLRGHVHVHNCTFRDYDDVYVLP